MERCISQMKCAGKVPPKWSPVHSAFVDMPSTTEQGNRVALHFRLAKRSGRKRREPEPEHAGRINPLAVDERHLERNTRQ